MSSISALFGALSVILSATTASAELVTYLAHRPVILSQGESHESFRSHAVYHDRTAETFSGEDLSGVYGTFLALGDGHAVAWVSLVSRGTSSWIREAGWLLSNGTFVPDGDQTTIIPYAKVDGTDLGDYYAWVEGDYFTVQPIWIEDIRAVGLDQTSTYYNLAHPGIRAAFRTDRRLRSNFIDEDDSSGMVSVHEFYEPLGENPDLKFLGAGAYRVRGKIWDDVDRNGLIDSDEAALPGHPVRLLDESGDLVAFRRTDAEGHYAFDLDEAGTYVVEVSQPLNTRTAPSTPPGEATSLASHITGFQAHNNPDLSGEWDVTARTPAVTVEEDRLVATLNAGLTPLPVVRFTPSLVRVTEPPDGQLEEILVMVEMSRLWDQTNVVFDFIPGSEEVTYPGDIEMLPGIIMGASIFDLRKSHAIRIVGDNRDEGTETMLLRYDRTLNPEISSDSTGLTLIIEEEESPPPDIESVFSELYVGEIGGDVGSPAILFRKGSGAYQFGGYAAAGGEAFFAPVNRLGDRFTFTSPLGAAEGVFVGETAEGRFAGTGGEFSLTRVSLFGPFADAAGLYHEDGVAEADWEITAALTPDGRLLFYSEYEGEGSGGALTLDSNGDFSVSIGPGSRVRGTVASSAPFEIVAVLDEGDFTTPLRLQRVSALDPDLLLELHFNTLAAEAGLTGPDAEPDATPFDDGVSNLLKYAFNMDLAGPDSHRMTPGGGSGLPVGSLVEEDGQTYWRVEYLRREDGGLSYTPQKSGTLEEGGFAPLAGEETVSDIPEIPGWERVIIDEPYDPATQDRCFFRVRVGLP